MENNFLLNFTLDSKNILEELKWRNNLKDISNEAKVLQAEIDHRSIYCGIDPTGDSLHLGNLLQLILLKRFALFGLQPIALIGGATAMIGDPSDKLSERILLDEKTVNANILKIQTQIQNLVVPQYVWWDDPFVFIKDHYLLDDNDLKTLKMIVKSINLNDKYYDKFAHILLKLPLPWAELQCDLTTWKQLYQTAQLDPTILILKERWNALSFKELFLYWNSFLTIWKEFYCLSAGFLQTPQAIKEKIQILNNQYWLNQIPFITILRDTGKFFNLSYMLGVKTFVIE